MNQLFGTLDAKLSRILYGKTPLLAQTATMPSTLLGNCYFFTTGSPVYASRAPGYSASAAYSHAPYSTLLANLSPAGITWDETNKVALLPGRTNRGNWSGATAYAVYDTVTSGGVTYCCIQAHTNQTPATATGYWLPCDSAAKKSVFDGSLQAMYVMHQGASDAAPVKYYLQESATIAPDKIFRLALAEIIIEGTNAVAFNAAWDKYNCFRLHNLNAYPAIVTFATGGTPFVVNLPAYACATIRRDDVATNYRAGYVYFFKAEAGDPRFYWFWRNISDGRAVDSMAANNLSNPAIIYDWIKYFLREVDTVNPNTGIGTVYANLIEDASVQCDQKNFYASQFGDPSNNATIFGDLLHHKGNFLLVRVSKTQTDAVTGYKFINAVETVAFNGYATIVADFAAHQLSVAENGSGDYVISSTDSANTVYLIPISTNLFKRGEDDAKIIQLDSTHTFTIENAVFENNTATSPDNANALTATPQQLIFNATLATAANNRSNVDWYSVNTSTLPLPGGATNLGFSGQYNGSGQTLYYYTYPNVVAGQTINTLSLPNRSTSKTIHGVHKFTVADILKMDWWGDPAAGNQNGTYLQVTNRALTLTPQGLVLTYTEQYSGIYAGTTNWTLGLQGSEQKKAIQFRGHGWGFVSDVIGSRATGFFSPRYGRFQCGNNFTAETIGVGGEDFEVHALNTAQVTNVKLLRRNRVNSTVGLAQPANKSRFWQNAYGDDNAINYWNAFASLRRFNVISVSGSTWTTDIGVIPATAELTFNIFFFTQLAAGLAGSATTNPYSPAPMPPLAMALLPEMYNGIARAINSVASGVPLDWQCLRWNFNGTIIPFEPRYVANGNYIGARNFPAWAAANSYAKFSIVQYGGNYYQTNQDIVGNVSNPAPNAGLPWSAVSFAGELDGFSYMAGPLPLDCFAAFDDGSLFHQFCLNKGIPVMTEADLPLNGEQNCFSAPAVTMDYFEAACTGCTITPNGFTWATSGNMNSGTATNATVVTTFDLSISSELLDTSLLLNGQATGQWCLGTYDPNSGVPAFPDSDPRRFYVAANDGTDPVGGTNIKQGDIIAFGNIATAVPMPGMGGGGLYVSGVSASVKSGLTAGNALMPDGSWFNLSSGFAGLRWVRLSDVEAFFAKTIFRLSFVESILPMSLKYFEATLVANAGNAVASGTQTLSQTYPFSYNGTYSPTTADPAELAADTGQAASYIATLPLVQVALFQKFPQPSAWWGGSHSKGMRPHGTLIKFFPDTRFDPYISGVPRAKWKLRKFDGASYPGPNYKAPQNITNIVSRADYSPLCHFFAGVATLSMGVHYIGSAGYQLPAGWPGGPAGGGAGGDGIGSAKIALWGSTAGDPKPNPPGGFGSNVLSLATGWNYGFGTGTRPSSSSIPKLTVNYAWPGYLTDPQVQEDFANLLRVPYIEQSVMDHYETLAFQFFGTPRSIVVQMNGKPAWRKATDCWGDADGLWTLDGGGQDFNAEVDNLPFVAVNAPASKTIFVGSNPNLSTPNGGAYGIGFVTADPQQRYDACFNMARTPINLANVKIAAASGHFNASGTWTVDSTQINASST